jgi:hypothetical protein
MSRGAERREGAAAGCDGLGWAAGGAVGGAVGRSHSERS